MKRILVISHSAYFTAGVRRILEEAVHGDCDIVSCAYVDTAIAEAQTRPCDLVMLDALDTPWHAEEITRNIMSREPLPIMLCSSDDSGDGLHQALDAGAIASVRFPREHDSPEERISFYRSMQLISEVKVVKRWGSLLLTAEESASRQKRNWASRISIVGIGASAGGTTALKTVLSRLRAPFKAPIVVVQHISEGHVHGLARWLDEQSALSVVVASDNARMRPGEVYLAPDDMHLTVDRQGIIHLDRGEKIKGIRPAISRLFESIHQSYGAESIAVLLSGMGDDGAMAMRTLFDAGAMTIAQDKESSLIHGIPGEAIRLSAARLVLGLEDIGPAVNAFVDRYAADSASKTESALRNTA
jgi:two-component system chemotaxis response regulator CheB